MALKSVLVFSSAVWFAYDVHSLSDCRAVEDTVAISTHFLQNIKSFWRWSEIGMESEFCDVFRNFTLRFALFVPRESLFYIFLKKKKKQDASFLKTKQYLSIQLETIAQSKLIVFILRMLLWIAHIFQILVPEIAGHLNGSLYQYSCIFSDVFHFMSSIFWQYGFIFWQKYCVQLDVLGNSFLVLTWEIRPKPFSKYFHYIHGVML